ncbi:hypothetical protein TUM17560_17410 [Serratia marcescens]|nr:hypothetical protein TUM17560_17410 [Serratia marcescens]
MNINFNKLTCLLSEAVIALKQTGLNVSLAADLEKMKPACEAAAMREDNSQPVAEVRLVDDFCGCCQRPDVEWLGQQGSLFPVGTKFYTTPPTPVYPERLPCPVRLMPGLLFGRGVPTVSMLDALKRREDYEAELESMTPEQRVENDVRLEKLKALIPLPAPSRHQLVPVEPTPEMIAAAMNCDDVQFNDDETFCVNFGNIYAAMLAAVPETSKTHAASIEVEDRGLMTAQINMSRETRMLVLAAIKHAEKTSAVEMVNELKRLCLCNPDSEKQSHIASTLSHILMHLQDPESPETDMRKHIRQDQNM